MGKNLRHIKDYALFLKVTWGLCWWSSGWDSTLPVRGRPGLIPGQGTRSHMSQLGVHMPQLKIRCAATRPGMLT